MTTYTSRNTRPIPIEDVRVGDRVAFNDGTRLGIVDEVLAPAPAFGQSLFLVMIRGKRNRPVYRKFAPGCMVDLCVPVEPAR